MSQSLKKINANKKLNNEFPKQCIKFYISKSYLQTQHNNCLKQGFSTDGICIPWGCKAPRQGVRDEASE